MKKITSYTIAGTLFFFGFVGSTMIFLFVNSSFVSNVSSEYAATEAMFDIKRYVETHEGRWPSDPSDLGYKYPVGGDVFVDYSASAQSVLSGTVSLSEIVRPRSGKYYTNTGYQAALDSLFEALKKHNSVPSEKIKLESGATTPGD